MHRQRVWDLPIRLFHWSLVASVVFAYVSGKVGGNLIDWHGRAGFLIIGLVIFRIVWGFVGTPTARFASFVRGPGAIGRYLRNWRSADYAPAIQMGLVCLALCSLLFITVIRANDRQSRGANAAQRAAAGSLS